MCRVSITIKLGVREPVARPEEWIRIANYRAPCERCMFVFWGRALDLAKEVMSSVSVIERPRIPALRGVVGDVDGCRVCVYQLCIGAPATAIAMEILIAAGVRRFMVFGGCGSISPAVRIYDVVVPTWGIREEGTSYHYLPPNAVPRMSDRVVEVLRRELEPVVRRLGIELHIGGVWSTDAVFRETMDKIEEYRERGVLCVDMESTAIMSIAMYRGVEVGIALVVMDELYEGKWILYRDSGRMLSVEKSVIEKLLKILAKL